jgi:hypothetical protein
MFLRDMQQAQYGNEFLTRVQLAEECVKLTTCRGWNSFEDNVDLGLIVAYIKQGGVVAYRTLVGIKNNNPQWDAEETLDEAGINNTYVHVHRLNDYRIGFAVTGINKEFISTRNLSGQGVKTEFNNLWVEFYPITMSNHISNSPTFKITEVNLLAPYTIEVIANCPIGIRTSRLLLNNITHNYTGYAIINIYANNGILYIVFDKPILIGQIIFTVPILNYLIYHTGSGFNYFPAMTFTYLKEWIEEFNEFNNLWVSANVQTITNKGLEHSLNEFSEFNNLWVNVNIQAIENKTIEYQIFDNNNEYNNIWVSVDVQTVTNLQIGQSPL